MSDRLTRLEYIKLLRDWNTPECKHLNRVTYLKVAHDIPRDIVKCLTCGKVLKQ